MWKLKKSGVTGERVACHIICYKKYALKYNGISRNVIAVCVEISERWGYRKVRINYTSIWSSKVKIKHRFTKYFIHIFNFSQVVNLFIMVINSHMNYYLSNIQYVTKPSLLQFHSKTLNFSFLISFNIVGSNHQSLTLHSNPFSKNPQNYCLSNIDGNLVILKFKNVWWLYL